MPEITPAQSLEPGMGHITDSERVELRAIHAREFCQLMDWLGRRLAAEQRLLVRHEAGELVRRRKADHRSPWDTKLFSSGKRVHGQCRWCGEPTTEPRRKYWHSACEDEFRIGDWNATLWCMTAIRRLLGRKCECGCGESSDELDHRTRLFDWDSPEAHFFANLQWLNHDCHARKSGFERRNVTRDGKCPLFAEEPDA